MDLLAFARGPALAASLAVFAAGTAWRVYAVLRRPRRRDLSAPRREDALAGAWRAIWRGMLPRREIGAPGLGATINAWGYHLGLLVIVVAFAPHIGFFERLTGIGWAALPDAVTYAAVAVTVAGLLAALANRLTDDVLRMLSGFDDYFSWALTMAPIVTGMALLDRPYVPAPAVAPALAVDPTLLAVHLLSLEALLLWFSFGKLAHGALVFVTRARHGAAATRRGAAP